MLEDQVAYLLQRYLGNYVRGLNKEALKISVWQGDVELTNMQLKPEALNALQLPVKVKAGFLGSVKLKVPWSRLGQDPVLVYLDRIFLLAEPATEVEGQSEDAVQEAKKSRIRETEKKLLEKAQRLKSEVNSSWLGSLINTIIGNLKLSISNIHIRYEDHESNPGHPFGAGVTLGKLSAVTIDEYGMETFVTGGTLDCIRKSVELDQLALYLDSDISPWYIDKPWEDLLPSEWVQVFRFGTNNGKPAECIMKKHSYVLQPVSGNAKYTKLSSSESNNSGQPLQKAVVNLDDVTLCLSKNGYRDVLKLADNFAAFNQRLKYAHYRPHVSVKSDPRSWWRYAYRAVSDQMKAVSGKLSWDQVLRYASLRKRYISLYASLLKSDPNQLIIDDNKEIEELDRQLDIELIIQWRMLAHKFVEQSVESELYSRKERSKKSWWSFGWGNQSLKDGGEQFHFTEEDWQQLNQLIGYKEGDNEHSVILNEKVDEKVDFLHTFLEVHMQHNASKLVDDAHEGLAELSCDDLSCSIKLYPETKVFDLKLGSYRLSSPIGLLAESANTLDSLVGVFCYKPFDTKVDWSMVVKASPCYMTYLKDSVDGIIKFFESNDAVSHAVALETAAAVQMTIDGVKRTAQQQVNRALKDESRFLLDLDIAAPKITIPTDFRPDNIHSTKLLLDLGNLVIRSQDDYERKSSEDLNLYLQFDLALSDVSAFLVDGDYKWSQTSLHQSANSGQSSGISFLPVIDKCGVIFRLQQIRLQNPSYPATRISVQLPSLWFYFSPARYHRLMQVAKVFQEEDVENSNLIRPWFEADFEGWLRILTRRGMANREAVWQRQYLCLVGPFLYVLESPRSKSYKQYLSLRGKQIFQLPEELVGVKNLMAICDAGRPINKILEDVNVLILRYDSDDLLRTWQSRLQGAIYRASGSAPITGLSASSSDADDSEMEPNDNLDASDVLSMERLFLTGALDELKISFNYNHQQDLSFLKVLLAEESPLFEFRALGGQVELSMRENDMFIGTVLKSLEIEDLVCSNKISQTSFLARSVIGNEGDHSCPDVIESFDINNRIPSEGEDNFYEASENLVDTEYLTPHNPLPFDNAWSKPPSFGRITGLLPTDSVQNKTEDIELTNTLDSFVKAQIVIYDQNSSLYKNIDMQVSVTLATLSFFCRRPTVLAIMQFVNAINIKDEKSEALTDNDSAVVVNHDYSRNDVVDDHLSVIEEPVVKGLLGKGKSRIIFNIVLNMARAQIFLMNENDTKLATFSQENLLTDIKVFPSSYSIKAALGNLRISDESLPGDHAYFWICDMRNPGGSSFVELVFTSFSADDEDYEGFEYSLFGQLSEVRIIYLNRFVQEIVSYFMGLVPDDNPKHIVKLKDRATDSEKSFTASEIEGSPALKLDLSLRKPIILMPRRTDSSDYLKLDVVHITLRNTFQWLHGGKSEINAVHVEMLMIQVDDINLNVGSATELGESIIRDVKGISISIRRSLRDLLHKIPSIEVAIKIGELKASLSNKEYLIITECALSNISESPNIVPPLKHDSGTSVDVIEPIFTQNIVGNEIELQNGEAWVSMKVSVHINLIELSLLTGVSRDAPLATIQVAGAWLLYKSNNIEEGFLSATLKGFTVIDDREGTEEEFRLAIGKPEKIGYGSLHFENGNENQHMAGSSFKNCDEVIPTPTMLILDAKFGQHLTHMSVCVQRPQLLVALDFLLAVVEFFVPTAGNMLYNDENKNPSHLVDAIKFNESIYRQCLSEFSLSPSRPLIVDNERYDHFIYDGQGGILHLKDRQGHNLSAPSKEAIIYVGSGKRLQFKNVVIKNGKLLDSCIWLGSNSSYVVSKEDAVHLEEEDEASYLESSGGSINNFQPRNPAVERSTEFVLEFQAIGPELTFYNTSQQVGMSPIISNKLLHAQLDAFARLVSKSDTTEMTANALGLTMESNEIRILEPFDVSVNYSNASGKTNIRITVSNIFMNFTFSILRLFLAVEEDILAFLRMTSKQMTVTCSEFDKVGSIKNQYNDLVYNFWRPRAPPGFAVLGDYLTPGDKPPTKGVVAVNMNFARVKRPTSFKLIWPLSASKDPSGQGVSSSNSLKNGLTDGEGGCSVWFPEAPKGYVALGCVVSAGRTQPPLSSFCISASLVSPCSLRDFVAISTNIDSSSLAFWRVENSVGTFLPADPTSLSMIGEAYELYHLKFGLPEFSPKASKAHDAQTSPSGDVDALEKATSLNSGRRFEAVASFQLIWWNRNSSSRKKISIWRPVVPEGMVYFGDIAVKGYEPPNSCIVLHDTGDEELFKAPSDYQLVGHIKKNRGMESISFWMPQAPPGFVSLGCIACKGSPKPNDFCRLRCMRSDMVTGDQFLEETIWDTSEAKLTKEPFSLWTVGNELGTFIVRSGFKKPPRRFALKLADPNIQSDSDDTVIDAEVGTFSVAIFDDYGGLMVPLFNISLSGIGFNLNGRNDYLNSTVSFSLAARSYNDKLESWEPLIEPVDGFLRYQYDLNAPGAASQIRLTSTREFNLNVTVSNMNMIIQAYSSWNNLTNVHEFYKKKEVLPPTYGARSVMDIHQKKNYYIIPENKLGQDIFIRATEVRGPSDIIRMPSGDVKPVKVLVSKNMLDSHLNGKICAKVRAMATVVIMDAELPRVEGLTSNIYTVALRLTPHHGLSGDSPFHQQSARTSGSISNLTSSELELVNWNEIFFFKVDFQENYNFELTVSDMGKGDAVGFFSASLNQIAIKMEGSSNQSDYLRYATWIDLSPAKHRTVTNGDKDTKSCGRIKCAVLLSPGLEVEEKDDILVSSKKSGLIQISPSVEGPWTTVRLNYAAPAACWRLGNEAVASEVSVKDGNRLVTIRSLVSVRNNTDLMLDVHLVSKASINPNEPEDSHSYGEVQTDEFFETEVFKPTTGWVGCSNSLDNAGLLEGSFKVELPTSWEWIDDWHLDASSINNPEGWVYSPDVESLKWPESYDSLKSVNHARQRRWVRNRRKVSRKVKQEIPVGLLKPGDTVPLPLSCLTQFGMYVLQLRPSSLISSNQYSWSSVVDRSIRTAQNGQMKDREICVSNLKESEELCYCAEISNTSSNGSHKLWFCVSIQASQIAKDINSDPILDWNLVVKSPLSITNFLPLVAEYSVLEMQTGGHFLVCQRGILPPGKSVKIHTADIRKPLFFSMLPQRGWLPIQEAVLISHPNELPSKTISLRSSISGRIVQLILEQNYEKEQLLLAKTIRVYAPYWFSIARCPPLTYRLVDLTGRRNVRKIALPFESRRSSEVILGEITDEEICEGYTIASALNFNVLGLSVSIAQTRQGQHFEPVKDLSSLGDMDGSLDLYAYDADGNCMRLFISSKPCSYQSVPTKVISVRPFMTFTNRLGQDMYIKLSSDDEPKKLHAFDSRVSFIYRKTVGTDTLQVRLEDSGWSFPVQITKEDTIFLVVRRSDGTRQMLRTEIRGFEEGSRFIVVFRLGSTDGPIRIENRTRSKTVSIRQSGFGDGEWIMLEPLSTANFSWEDPYGQKIIDAKIDCDGRTSVHKFDLGNSGISTMESAETELQFHVIDLGDIKICRFMDNMGLTSRGERNSLTHSGYWGNLHGQGETQNEITPLELIVEIGVVGISVVDHRPKELSYLYLERVFYSYSTGYDGGTTSRFKLILGYVQLDNQLPLTLMPVLLAPEQTSDIHNPVFKMTVTQRNENSDGIQVYPYVYIRVTEKVWRVNIHEPIIWALIDFYNNLQLNRLPQSSNVALVDPEIHVGLIDVSEIRLKVSLETAPAQRPHGVLGVWSPILSAVGNAFKIQVHLRRVMHRDRFMRKSSIVPAIGHRIWRDLIHNPLHLIFSVDVLGMTSSTLASLSKGFAELSTDGQFLQLRSKQVGSRRITGVGDGIVKGTEALAQGVAFGLSGVLTKPVESARQNGLLGLANGLGRAFLGFIVQPVSGAFDFFSLTVDGIGASCSKCLEGLSNKTSFQRTRNPRAIHADCILREYSEKEAMGQMILYLAEASRRFGCTEIFKEPSKFAWSDCFEEFFFVPYQRIVLVSNKRTMLLQCPSLDKMDKKPSKIMWDVPWEDLMALELAKAGHHRPSHLLLHLKHFRKSENFVRVIKCNVEDESDENEPQAVRICSAIRRVWKMYQSDVKTSILKVPSSQRHVYFSLGEAGGELYIPSKTIFKSRELSSSSTASDEGKFIKHGINFSKIWSSEREPKGRCKLCRKQDLEDERICSIWRPICPNGYVSIGDIARVGSHPPNVAALYRYIDNLFAAPLGYDLVWRNCLDDYKSAVSIWHPRAPEGFVSPGCVAVDGFEEPAMNLVWCVAESIVEQTEFEEQKIWSAKDSYPWACHIYQVRSDALHFAALRQVKEESDWRPVRVVDDQQSSPPSG